jgi:hypothetical protein
MYGAPMTNFRVFLLSLALGGSACFTPAPEKDCFLAGTCECRAKIDCQTGFDCVNGKCFLLPDAGAPGDIGWPCDKDAECLFGICLPNGPGNGKVCSISCNADAGFNCQKGWECKSRRSDFVCVPPLKSQCLSCNSDSDCNALGDKCLQVNGQSFCTQDCTLSNVCPGGSECRSVMLDGSVARQCVPKTESCECTALTAGVKRACKKTNPKATCFGYETCRADGTFSGCDALEASQEVCDGIDNDCDGFTDQTDSDLDVSSVPNYPNCQNGVSCIGKVTCGPVEDGGFSFNCSAPKPRPEACNGADDNCDGQVDEGLTDVNGNYITVRACGSCSSDCFTVLKNLETKDGLVVNDAASCEVRNNARTCVPLKCEKGFFPSPPNAPQICERAVTSQCRSCQNTGDCLVPGDECVPGVGSEPAHCEQSCETSSPYANCTGQVGVQSCCPSGSTCRATPAGKKCQSNTGSCVCTPARAGFTRSCTLSSMSDVCVGQEICGANGQFSDCDTSQTALEFCDNKDNNCNGFIDEGFINTKATGTYDTDAHCGMCNNNCKAKWSETIQHAVGGCVSGILTPPNCKIIQCTSGATAGGGLCRTDSECGPGNFTCDPVLHQCVKACTGPNACNPGQMCVNGFCGSTCTTDAQCTQFGTASKCISGVCSVNYQFSNADNDETNGCECASVNVVDVPETFTVWPQANFAYPDRNCDGVDGVEATSLFVWAQSTSSLGTRVAPFKTIAQAISAFQPGVHTAILVAQGTYVEQVQLKNSVAIFGGYSSDFLKRNIILFPTLIEAAEPTGALRGTVNAENITAPTTLSGFTIRGYDVISVAASGVAAKNSMAVYIKNSPGFSLLTNHVVGGKGGDAAPAAIGNAGANGGAGANGLNARECNSQQCSGETQPGGVAGMNAECPAMSAGVPGGFTDPNLNPQPYPTGGQNGRGGNNANYAHSDPSQTALCKYDCTVPTEGLVGGPAQNGGDGQPGPSGQSCNTPLGSVIVDDWSTPIASVGNPGTPGRGGGGGGAGGCVTNSNPATCTIGRRVGDLGGTGGGGGAGGCGGAAGRSAAGGGASFSVFIVGANANIAGNLIDLGFGGQGGKGGAGGYGGLGGQGGRGGTNTTVAWCAGQGGPGGRGGNGGAGPGGAGGCGGSVFGIAGTALSALIQMQNTIAPAPMNAVGAPGLGGVSPAGIQFQGATGSVGVLRNFQSF